MRDDVEQRRHQLLALLLAGHTPLAAAAAMNVSRRTVARYMAEAGFAAELRDLQGDQLRALARRALDRADEAISALSEIAEDVDAPDMARVMAAQALISATHRLAESVSLADQVRELQLRLDEQPAEA